MAAFKKSGKKQTAITSLKSLFEHFEPINKVQGGNANEWKINREKKTNKRHNSSI